MGCALETQSREEAVVTAAVNSRGIVDMGGSPIYFMPAARGAEMTNVQSRVQKGNVLLLGQV